MAIQIQMPAGNTILQDSTLQHQLSNDGFTKLPTIPAYILNELKLLYQKYHPSVPTGPIPGFYVSVHSPDLAYKLAIQQGIKDILTEYLQQVLINYQCFISAFQVKDAKHVSALGIHQDWNAVDENKFASYGIWIPLVDVGPTNGAIYFLKGSHRIRPTYRHMNLPSIYSEVTEHINALLQPVFAKEGEPLMFNQSILHYSPNNLSGEIRPTALCTITNKEAVPTIYFPNSSNPRYLTVYEVQPDYLQYYNSFFEDAKKLPASAKPSTTASFEYDFTPLTTNQFIKLVNSL